MAETEHNTKALLKDKKRLVKAVFSYEPVNIDELQLKENDILEVIEETEEGWWKGILNGNTGMFPSNFVTEISEDLNNLKQNELSPTKIKTKINNLDLLDFLKKDSTITPSTKHDIKTSNISSSDNENISVQKNSELFDKKIFTNKKNLDSKAPQLPPKPVREQAKVIYPYAAMNEDELSLKEGDIITVISKEIEDKGWWKGELNNRTGVFPDNFVQLIKVEEQKKPERPDKPSIVRSSKVSLKSLHSDKNTTSEISPKTEKSVVKTPPAKPPPPETYKKEIERPFLSKKPQVPHPMKKPSRSSIKSSKFSGFSSTVANAVSKVEVICPAPVQSVGSAVNNSKFDSTKGTEKTNDKEIEKDTKDSTFEGLESSGKKLVHLTANRAKAPNRRPPSHIFLRDTEKENSTSSSDPRRLSEPLLSEMKSLIGDFEPYKNNTIERTDLKSKAPPVRPMPPSIKANKPVLQGSIILTKTISSEECIVKAPEPIKKSILPDVSMNMGPETIQLKKVVDIPSSGAKSMSSENSELRELKESLRILMASTVSKNEYNELLKQVKELKEDLDRCNTFCKKNINDLKAELDAERQQRLALEIKLSKLKECQTT